MRRTPFARRGRQAVAVLLATTAMLAAFAVVANADGSGPIPPSAAGSHAVAGVPDGSPLPGPHSTALSQDIA